MAQTLTLTKWHAYSQHRSSNLSASPLSLERQALLGFVEYVDSKCPDPTPVVAPTAYREGMGEILSDACAWYREA